ncbi:hypothetical protein JCM10212_005437 [Sporobolomyces blumeae]
MPPFRTGGGKKGMRQVTSKHQKKIILRPAPPTTRTADDAADADLSPSKGKEKAYFVDEDDDYLDGDAEEYGYRESLREERLPLVGLRVSVSGCSGTKEDLLKTAEEYGAERQAGLHEDTTHLVTDKAEGAKYKIALQRRMKVMQPSWLEAVREAWKSGESIDYDQLENEHRLLPLTGVVFTMTQFAHGPHKDDYRDLLIDNGAEYSPNLSTYVTHLVVASPTSPHSQTPSSDKLLHARKNRKALHPELLVVWEGWARETIKYGGRREDRDAAWIYREGHGEPGESYDWIVPEQRVAAGTANEAGLSSAAKAQSATRSLSPSSRTLSGGAGASTSSRRFTGYDTSLIENLDGASSRNAPSVDLQNGKILKKRRRTAGPDASQGNPEQLISMFGAAGTGGPRQSANDLRSENVNAAYELPKLDDLPTGLPVPPARFEVEDEDTVLEMVEGEVGLQRTKKSKSAIKALSSKRAFVESEPSMSSKPKSNPFGPTRASTRAGGTGDEAGAYDDSAFFEAVESVLPESLARGKRDEEGNPTPSPAAGLFDGLSFALMGIRAREPETIAKVIRAAGGTTFVDANEAHLEKANWIIVDFAEPPRRFAKSADPRIVSVCWIELCLWAERVLDVEDRVLDRPIPFACPVTGAEKLKIHFSGFSGDDDPIMHHNRRYLHAVGAIHSEYLDRSCSHLVLFDLENDPLLDASAIDASKNRKVAKAREWGVEVTSMRDVRKRVAEMAATAEREEQEAVDGSEAVRASSDRKRRAKEGTYDDGRDDETVKGPLSDCVVYFSSKSNMDRQALAYVVQDLGGTAARQYSESVTHFVHSADGSRGSESYKDLKSAKAAGCALVHPKWVEECGRNGSRAPELDFPHTFDSRKGGQLLEAGMSMNGSPSPPRAGASRAPLSREGTEKVEELRMGKTSRLEFDRGPSGGVPGKAGIVARSPSPRRRRSGSDKTNGEEIEGEHTRQEVVAEDVAAGSSSPPIPRPDQPKAVASPERTATNRLLGKMAASSSSLSDLSSSAPQPFASERHPLPSLSAAPTETELSNAEKKRVEAEQAKLEEERKKESLRQRTSLLLAEMQSAAGGGSGNSKSRTIVKKQTSMVQSPSMSKPHLSPSRTTSLPTVLPSSSPSRFAERQLNQFEPTQVSQYPFSAGDGEGDEGGRAGGSTSAKAMFVRYDNPEQVRAREEIKKRLDEAAASKKREGRQRKGRGAADDGEDLNKRVTRSAKKGTT